MTKHIVMWKIKDESKAESALKIKNGLEGLVGKIDGLISAEVGINTNPSDMAFDVVLYSEFTSQSALDGYQSNPLHLEVAGFVRSVAVERHVVDYEC